mmetsp:Transcript_91494/g.179187  ORF Transcript_91494/g.179187 Transcript_91494/m.179187 type:complete len:236 (-) Transcript_91494:639-1346(-)
MATARGILDARPLARCGAGPRKRVTRAPRLLLRGGGHVEFEEDDIAILHLVGLPLLPVSPGGLHRGLGALLLELVEGHDLGADEPPLEVRVDHTCCLGRLVPFPDDPRPDLVGPGGVEIDQVHHVERGLDDFRKRASHFELLQLLRRARSVELDEVVLHGAAVWDDGGTRRVHLHPIEDRLQELVLLPLIIMQVHVHSEQDRLRGEELQLVQHINVMVGPDVHAISRILAVLEEL